MSGQGRNKRIDFSPEVKCTIWRRAGGLCSVCLEPVFGTDNNFDLGGPAHGATSVGEAAHIYSASEHGPRGNSGKSKEFLGSAANGISTCRTCHGNVDSVESKYCAEDLFDMKRVREISQDIARHVPGVGRYVARVGVDHLDQLVRQAVDRDDHQSIADAFMTYAEIAKPLLGALKNYCGCSMPRPTDFALLPLIQAVLSTVEVKQFLFERKPIGPILDVNFSDLPQNDSGLIARTLDLSESWAGGQENIRFNDDKVQCIFFTKDPVSGEPGVPVTFTVIAGVWRAFSPERGLFHGIEVRRFESRAVGFDWKLHAMVRSDGHMLHSSLALKRFACPDSSEDERNCEVFRGYIRLLKEIQNGRLPCARLGMLGVSAKNATGLPSDEDPMHPLEFSMSVEADNEQIREVVALAERILMGNRVAGAVGTNITYRKKPFSPMPVRDELNPCILGFFNHGLTEEMIRVAMVDFQRLASVGEKLRSKSVLSFEMHGLPYRIQAFHKYNHTQFMQLPC